MCKDNHMDDTQLLQSCLEGNVENYKKVIEKYKGKALALAWNYTGNREDAEDACQDAFLKAYLNLGSKKCKRRVKMLKKKIVLVAIFVTGLSFLNLMAQSQIDMKMRFFEGIRQGEAGPPKVVTSSYLQPTITASFPSKFLLAEEKEQIKSVFNLQNVRLITEADLNWKSWRGDLAHIFRLDGHAFQLKLTPVKKERIVKPNKIKEDTGSYQFKIDIAEIKGEEKISLMDTEIILPEKNIAVFGFEDREGKPYFLSFHVTGVNISPPPPPPPPPPPDEEAWKKKIAAFEKGAVKIEGELKPPKLIKRVNPVYPTEARREKVERVVILGARIDEEGYVQSVMVYKSKTPLLNKAAIDAIKQWRYEPLYIDEKAVPAVFTITVRFALNGDAPGEPEEGVVRLSNTEAPKLIKRVNPIYPEEAKKAGIQGVVLLETKIDKQGQVSRVVILKSESSVLNKAAVDAVKQWVYEPYFLDGKATPVLFPVTVRFKLT